jgi:hypothetical protein
METLTGRQLLRRISDRLCAAPLRSGTSSRAVHVVPQSQAGGLPLYGWS